jgi:hypothetical protein
VKEIRKFWNSLGIVGKTVTLLLAASVAPALVHPAVLFVVVLIVVAVIASSRAKVNQ